MNEEQLRARRRLFELVLKSFAEGHNVGYTFVSRDGFYDCAIVTFDGKEREFPEFFTVKDVEERWKEFR